MMKEQQDKLRQEYEFKLADLEREREGIEEEKAQVYCYLTSDDVDNGHVRLTVTSNCF